MREQPNREPRSSTALSRGQGEHSQFPVRSASVGIVVSCVVGELPEDAIALIARQLGCDHRYFLPAHRCPCLWVGQQVPRPRGVIALSVVAADQEKAIAFSQVSQWYLPTTGLLTAEGGSCPQRTSGNGSSFTANIIHSHHVRTGEFSAARTYFAACTRHLRLSRWSPTIRLAPSGGGVPWSSR
jgi:hypothetical protein